MKRWTAKPLTDVASIIRGVTFDKSKVSDAPTNNSIPVLRAGNIQESLVTDSDLVYVPAELVSNEQKMRRGDLAICMSSGSASIVGKTAHLDSDWNGSVGAFCAIVRFNPNLHHRLGSYWFRSPAFLEWRNRNAQGANIQNLRRTELENLSIPVPPMAEQERIVKLLDESDELRKLRVKADKRTAEFIPALFHDMFGGPIRNARGIAVVRVEEAGRVQLGRQRSPKYQTGKFTRPYVRVANVFEDRIDVSDLLSMDFGERDFRQYRLDHGDILLNEGQSTELVGRPAMWRNEVADCCFQNTLLRFQPNRQKVLPDFALGVFLTYFRTGEFAKLSGKTSSIAHLGAGRFAKMPFVFPPMPLQKEFALRVTEIRELEAGQAASRRRLEELFQSLLHRAFNGEL
jgi:type I restriction enzyme, S subunit